MSKTTILTKKERVIVYVDGFNLYFGMLDAGFDYCKWLNLNLLVHNLLHSNQELVDVKYFTSRVSNNPDKQKRQNTYIEALESVGVNIFYGNYQSDTIECKRCKNVWPKFNEKMTDVNIATHILIDAYQDKYDMAMLISGDSDLVPPMRAVHEIFKSKRVFVAFPPKRHNQSVALIAKGSLTIGRKKLVESQFEEKVAKKDGYQLSKPKTW
ncbi:NYN domain-containing protein [Flavobacterium nackdongense]|uniref:NYN domain-containing protein n=1 Tax=Flavobacterium nackdongense TaxID=2547394 RepID=A0A4P6YDU0_9FLAO|nr:NYN domain-containing protein [Flavobacterium nackdongense]QBN18945.1 NYN domain-containing protein [Flavobacterium nackdongense]